MVFILSAQKGGKGKSILTALIASSLAIDYGKRVLVIDGDEQSTLWDVRREDLEVTDEFPYEIRSMPVSDMATEQVSEYLDELKESKEHGGYDIVFVDLQGSVSDKQLIEVLLKADSVLLPVVGQQADMLSDMRYIETIKQIEEYKKSEQDPNFKLFAVLNRKKGWMEEKTMKQFCKEIGVELFSTELRELAIYSRFNTYESYASSPNKDIDQVRNEFSSFMQELVTKYNIN